MSFERFGTSLRNALKKVFSASHLDRNVIKEVARDIQRALLRADVNVKLTLELSRTLEQRALKEKPPAGMSAREHVARIIYEELVNILGEAKELKLQKQRLLLIGLYGQGKTTTAGKMARYFQKRGLKVAVIAGDVHRPAAYEQLSQIAEIINVPIYGNPEEKRAERIVKEGLRRFEDFDVVIVDTSGRHSLEDDLIEEIKRVSQVTNPTETVLVLDATMGQQAGPQAKAFHDAVGVTSVVLAKLDGSAKGGGALSAISETGASIVFIGTGEKIDDLEKFDPQRFISRLLGMGDLKLLLERAQEVMDEDKAKETVKRMMGGRFTLKDMYSQMEMLSGMGPLRKLMSLMPGMPGRLSDEELEIAQTRLRKFRYIMDSMTDEEMTNPRIVKGSRIARIARGSGTSPKDVRELLKQYGMSRKAIKGLAGNRKMRRQIMKQLKSADFDMTF
ncbi:MAG: signal recognition particle protein Srp54 [Thermoplasmata archaeon]